MDTTEMTTAPVDLDARTSSGSRCNPSIQEQENTIMTRSRPEVVVTRHEVKPVDTEHHDGQWATCATLISPHVDARVMRFTSLYRDDPQPDIKYEVQIRCTGWPDPAGMCDLTAENACLLVEMSEVCRLAADLLEETRGR